MLLYLFCSKKCPEQFSKLKNVLILVNVPTEMKINKNANFCVYVCSNLEPEKYELLGKKQYEWLPAHCLYNGERT